MQKKGLDEGKISEELKKWELLKIQRHKRLEAAALQAKAEKKAKAAQEWPIDISFLSKLIMLGLIPILSRLIASFLI